MYFDYISYPYQNVNPFMMSPSYQELVNKLQMTLQTNKQLQQKITQLEQKLDKSEAINKELQEDLATAQSSCQKLKKRKYIRKTEEPEMYYRCEINGCGRIYTSKTALVSHFRKKHQRK